METEIIEGLWMGGETPFPLAPSGFDYIVSLREVPDIRVPYFDQDGPVILWAALWDVPARPPRWRLDAAVSFIRANSLPEHKMLVHCTKGHNRSGLVIALYLVASGQAPQAAIDLIREKRPGSLTNQVFVDMILGE